MPDHCDHLAGRFGMDLSEGMLATDTITFHHGRGFRSNRVDASIFHM